MLLPVLAALPVLTVLLALGAWQVRRLEWKQELLAQVAASEAGPATPLGADPVLFQKVSANGRLDHAHEALLGLEVRGNTLGARLLTPLLRDNAPALLIDRGWVPMERTAAIERPEGIVTVIGWVRPSEPTQALAARDDPAGRRFYSFDTAAIGAALDLPAVAPFGLVALAVPADPPGRLPAPDRVLPRPNNPHLGYAITWFGLAAALIGVLGVFLVGRARTLPA